MLLILNFFSFNKYTVYANNKDITPNAHFSIAYDSKTGEILYEKNAFRCVPMASTTKILTALVAINYGNLDDQVTISKSASSIRGSTVGYKAGEKITLKELLFGLMYKSGNDAAIAIAEHLGGNVENFSIMMTDFARIIGLVDSNFQSPHGLDSQMHYSTAYDLALLMSKAMNNEFFREISGTKEIKKDKYGFTRDYNNINKILWRINNANGGKTGYTGQAGKCLVTSINHNERNLIIVVLNCPNRWEATEKVYEYVKDRCK
ncbi:D-alanyl-D-alanine carboxypeptidase family protein [Clostridium tarantellae]|uniref:D-alanyl-D-alanine carboxypeptidase family protein n=1 Tax=Clostridium tarantellae TaxID=39493 RepID=UPI002E0D4A5A